MKQSPILKTLPWWLSGMGVAAIGVLCARVIAPHLSAPAGPWLAVAGQVLALAGLIVIAFGVQRRVHARSHSVNITD